MVWLHKEKNDPEITWKYFNHNAHKKCGLLPTSCVFGPSCVFMHAMCREVSCNNVMEFHKESSNLIPA
jgi:hypothetical protein